MSKLSARAEATRRRTYNRPLDDAGTRFETWDQTIYRSHYIHHKNLWEGAGGKADEGELAELVELGRGAKGLVAGRTLWLGGTDYAYSRAASQFNCSALRLDTVYDMVDAFWLLLNGCGVGGKPKAGTLHGYYRPIPRLTVVPSTNSKEHRGHEENREELPTADNGYQWRVVVGDSAKAWAKALGKLLISPRTRTESLVLDFGNLRGPGGRLRGYGWICNGYEPLAQAFAAFHDILNRYAGNILPEEEIADIFNWCGTVLSSRRAAEALVMDADHPHAFDFARRKHEYWKTPGQPRRQSNNSLLFWKCPSVADISDLLYMNLDGGEPGFVNAEAALRRCPWFELFNPCFEICLASHCFCNLVSLSLPSYSKNFAAIERAIRIMSRANYRQTCVNLKDGILQDRWHQTNEALRLCGVSLTGIAQAGWLTDYQIRRLRNAAVEGAYSMADELGLPRPKAICTVKPEGTRSKITNWGDGYETAEGMHRPLGRYIHNWINFSTADPIVPALESAGYRTMLNPSDRNNVLVRFPIQYAGCGFTTDGRGAEVNVESAVDQLRRYRRWNTLWADHNVSATISLSREEVPEVAQWIHRNWGNAYIATAFIGRNDPTKTAADLGHPYLPQEVVTAEDYALATADLRPVDWDRFHTGLYEIGGDECAGGVCPIK